MKRCVILGAAPAANPDYIKEFISDDDFIIACDGGLSLCERLNITPSLIIGDFDSHPKPETSIETITLPCEKDDTDTFFAVKEAVRRGFKDFILAGVMGGRFDHSAGNISILLFLESHGCNSLLVDDYGTMQIVTKTQTEVKNCSFFSTIALSGPASGVYISNAKYNVSDGTIQPDFQYGISNELIDGKPATVRCENGKLLLIQIS